MPQVRRACTSLSILPVLSFKESLLALHFSLLYRLIVNTCIMLQQMELFLKIFF
jgi:hypothetical protein